SLSASYSFFFSCSADHPDLHSFPTRRSSDLFAAVGDFVKRGQPLLEISPNPTPLEMVELRRNVELREIELKNLERDLARQQELRSRNLISPADIEAAQQRVDESRNQLSLAQERLALQEGGKVLTGGKQVETVV